MGPITIGGADGDAQNLGGIFNGHPDEIAQLDQIRFNLALGGKLFEGLVHGQKFIVVARRGDFQAVELHALLVATMACGVLAARFLNQDPAHGLGGCPEEMGAAIKLWIYVPDQPEPGFMNERGGLQRLVGRLVGHFRRCELAQFAIDKRQQFLGGARVAVLDGFKNAGDVANNCNYTRLLNLARTNLR